MAVAAIAEVEEAIATQPVIDTHEHTFFRGQQAATVARSSFL